MTRIVWMIPAMICVLAGTARAGIELTPEETKTLGRGELVKHKVPFDEEKSVVRGTSLMVIDAPVEHVWAVMHDVTAWPRIFPYMYDAHVQFRYGQAQAVKLKVGVSVFNINSWAIMVSDPKKHEILTRLNEEKPNYAEEFYSRLQMIPQPGNRTLVVYAFKVRVSFGPVVALLGKKVIGKVEYVFLNVPQNLKKAAEGRKQQRSADKDKTASNAAEEPTK